MGRVDGVRYQVPTRENKIPQRVVATVVHASESQAGIIRNDATNLCIKLCINNDNISRLSVYSSGNKG